MDFAALMEQPEPWPITNDFGHPTTVKKPAITPGTPTMCNSPNGLPPCPLTTLLGRDETEQPLISYGTTRDAGLSRNIGPASGKRPTALPPFFVRMLPDPRLLSETSLPDILQVVMIGTVKRLAHGLLLGKSHQSRRSQP